MSRTSSIAVKEKSKNFDKYKRFYDSNMWTKKMVYNVVEKGALTAEEYEEITGEPYDKE